MPRRTTTALLLALAVAGALAAPFTPSSDAQVVERLPLTANDPSMRRVESLRRQLAARPDDADLRIEIARRYFDLAMAQGDPRYVGYATATLAPVEKLAPKDARYWLVRGLLQQYGHDFAAALRSLERASQLDPEAADPVAWRAAIEMVRARYRDALGECTRLVPLAHPLLARGCTAYVQASTGQLRPAYEGLQRHAEAAGDAAPELKLWVRTRLAEMAIRLQRPGEAEAHFKEALSQGVTDQFLLAAYSDFLLQRKRPQDVLQLLRGWERSDILLLRLALAGRMAGDTRAGGWVDELRDRFFAAAQRGDRLHEQEAARFALELENNPAKALEHARRNYQSQKEPRDAEILMRAALAAGQPKAAEPALAWLRANDYEDPQLAALAARLAAAGAAK